MMMASNKPSSWICNKCTFLNEGGIEEGGQVNCGLCQELRDDDFTKVPSDSNNNSSVAPTRDQARVSIKLSDLDQSHTYNSSMKFSDLDTNNSISRHSQGSNLTGGNSLMALGNMSFAAWELDRRKWTCKACTFVNEPRFLMCGACGMAEGSSGIEDELITAGLGHMSLSNAQQFLMDNIQGQLNCDREDELRNERVAELIEAQIEDEKRKYDEEMDSKTAKAWQDIHVLERVQAAEKGEHEEMRHMLEQWRDHLNENEDEEQEIALKRQEALLEDLKKEWRSREENLQKIKQRLEDGVST
mmetsp:Transcript_29385/g.59287  ORF Transcript_29385/g.59287 Transcript_29385/m.59287 type:complete len:301 (-) Transcript_29385:163-1065(-)|eukprot:CAMPEP_0171346094 /NCGR_PEP_ID=MMETSP0878-20121228/23472_1 /TAXON_ID=67004 /ORGANISM="Thalassiosira weissflogii, Strain CCMP1336" /LENGTH=300 /DNA_ID=CAMNT_0011849679 /DNA_START=65 /DNA_END=967 /DNA_ORIENTATION=-